MSERALLRLPSGAVLHVDDAPAPAPAVLFFHGVGGAAWSFAPQRAALRGRFRCFVWEGRGRGEGARVEDAGLADYYQDAVEALAAVGAATGKKPALLVGHSMGGLLALALACEQPGAVRGVFLIDPVYADSGALPVRIPRPIVALGKVFVGAVARSFQRDGWLGRAVAWPFFRWAFHDAAARARAWELQRAQVPLEYPRMLFESLEGVSGFPFQPFADRVDVRAHLVEALPRQGARSRFTSSRAAKGAARRARDLRLRRGRPLPAARSPRGGQPAAARLCGRGVFGEAALRVDARQASSACPEPRAAWRALGTAIA